MHVNSVISMVVRKFVHYIFSSKYHGCSGPAETVQLLWFGQTSFSQGERKNKVHFYKKQVIKKSASVIFGFFYWAIIDRKSTLRGARLSAAHALCLQGILLCKKLSNKHNGNVVFRAYNIIAQQIERGYQQ